MLVGGVFAVSKINSTLVWQMLPDYPHKIFDDKRLYYFLLMEALAMEASA